MKSICGLDCSACPLKSQCGGCAATNGRPFGGSCMLALRGAFVNLIYPLPGGQTIRFWDDDRIYLGNQLEKKNSDRCFGLTADEHHLLVCEYGENGSDPEIVVYQKRK